jgi:hypothetical protein
MQSSPSVKEEQPGAVHVRSMPMAPDTLAPA